MLTIADPSKCLVRPGEDPFGVAQELHNAHGCDPAIAIVDQAMRRYTSGGQAWRRHLDVRHAILDIENRRRVEEELDCRDRVILAMQTLRGLPAECGWLLREHADVLKRLAKLADPQDTHFTADAVAAIRKAAQAEAGKCWQRGKYGEAHEILEADHEIASLFDRLDDAIGGLEITLD